MPKVFENDIVYDYPPVHTLIHLFKKYPNPHAPHVYSVDTLDRSVDPETGIIRSERILGVQQGAPRWIAKMFRLPPTAYVREVVFIDPSIPQATTLSANLSLSQYVSCLEHITYAPHPHPHVHYHHHHSTSDHCAPPSVGSSADVMPLTASASPEPSKPEPGHLGPGVPAPSTMFQQRAMISSGLPTALIARRVEQASIDTFGKNAKAGKRGFEWVLNGGSDKKPVER